MISGIALFFSEISISNFGPKTGYTN